MQDNVLILDFGSQYTQLIARRVRELFIYCEIHPYNKLPDNMGAFSAVILSGSPFSVRSESAPTQIYQPFGESCPYLRYATVLSIWLTFLEEVKPSNIREYGRANLSHIESDAPFFQGIQEGSQVWMSHSDTIDQLPEKGVLLASTDDVENAAFRIEEETTYGIQFHPEVYHTQDGKQLLENFLIHIAGIQQQWTPDSFVEMTVKDIRETVGSEKVILGLSGVLILQWLQCSSTKP